MNNLVPLEFKNQRIILTEFLAESFGTERKIISNNFNRNIDRFIEGKHYYKLEGEELKVFKGIHQNDESLKFVSVLYLWTERGAARHAKILDTDEAWEVYEQLEETYFRVRENKTQIQELSPQLQLLINMELEQKRLKEEINEVNTKVDEAKQEVQAIRDAVTLTPNQWRKETSNIINKVAQKLGGFDHIKPIREESYKALNETMGVNLAQRLLNKKKKMALEGVPKSKIDKVNNLDVIADDKKLINGYVNIIAKIAIRYGV